LYFSRRWQKAFSSIIFFTLSLTLPRSPIPLAWHVTRSRRLRSDAFGDALTHALTFAVTCAQWGVERSGSVQYADVSWAHRNGDDDGASAGLPPRLVPPLSTNTDAAAGTNAQILTQPALPGLLFIAKDAVGIITGDASVLNVFFF
jgi:hypothetical protein